MNKVIVRNSIYNIIYKVFSVIFPLVTSSYVSRILLAEGVGKVAYAQSIVTYFVTLSSLGIPQYGIKAIAQSESSRDGQSKTFSELFIINLVSTVLWCAVYYTLINQMLYFADRRALFNTMGLLLILNIFNVDWFYQGIEKYGYIATRSMIVKLLSLISMFVFVRTSDDYINYGLILCIATAGNYLYNAANLRKYVGIRVKGIDLARHLKPVLILLVSAVATEIYTMLDTVMIEHIHGEAYVGYYSNAVKVVRVIYTLVIAMVSTFYPQISIYLNEGDYSESNKLLSIGTKIILLFSVPLAMGAFVLSDSVVLILFGGDFYSSIATLRILSVLICVFSLAYFLGHIILMSTCNEKKILKATIAGAVFNFCANSLLIPPLKHNGAAIASVLAELIVTAILLYNGKKFFKLNIGSRFVFSVIASSAAMALAVAIVAATMEDVVLKMIVGTGIGILTYGIGLLIGKNEILMDLLSAIARRFRR